MWSRHKLLALALVWGGCTAQVPPPESPPPESSAAAAPAAEAGHAPACQTASVTISFDFDGASSSRCAVLGEREFAILITPEHAPPINPSAWYAFRYVASAGGPITVRLRYLGGRHRYQPLLTREGEAHAIAATLADNGDAVLSLPAGSASVSGQELFVANRYRAALHRWSALARTTPVVLGRSHQGRAIEGVRLGQVIAPQLIILLGRQHPPEVTGALAMEAFVDRIAQRLADDPALAGRYQFLVVPLLNPDGVALGHWRANLGGVDLNRDWGAFTQPETRAVRDWLATLPAEVRPALMLDFHSTNRNLFYVQGDEAGPVGEAFLSAWLGGRENQFRGYPFAIERRDANPGSGTSKNWFHATYAIPAYTYEVSDNADRDATRDAAQALAEALPAALAALDGARHD